MGLCNCNLKEDPGMLGLMPADPRARLQQYQSTLDELAKAQAHLNASTIATTMKRNSQSYETPGGSNDKSEKYLDSDVHVHPFQSADAKILRAKWAIYEKLIDSLGINGLFEEITTSIEESTTLDNKVTILKDYYDEDHKIIIEGRDSFFDDIKYCEIVQKWSMNILPEDWIYFNILMLEDVRKKIDTQNESFDLLHIMEKNKMIYLFTRVVTKKMHMIKGNDNLLVTAFKKLENGNIIEVFKSWDHPDFPQQEDKQRITTLKGGTLFEMYLDDDMNSKWKCTNYRHYNPLTNIGVKLLKPTFVQYYRKFYTGIFKEISEFMENGNKDEWLQYIESIKKKFKSIV